ncbi:MAG: cobyrinate a,c-diamide synthase [Muribaculaceae bacterium]|nr:cobyrinate a,c-diamide synthase [Roseburia sp.]MCM1431953.1 cobyrinate a,c-diamide synthase [Muribaculaceae bacterium]MCM1493583.1 cobyrinate a,c-diamide synthase [Muribaculaceae bacterium]
MKIKRVMIAAPGSGSGKTVVTCALLQMLKNEGWKTASYKCGPDYIDPMFHERVIHIPAKNLDTFFTGDAGTGELFLNSAKGMDFAVLEGVMGLYDGLGGVRKEGSSYHLAEVTKTPVVLVVDAKGMGRSVIPLLAGFLSYDEKHLIRGVLLNRMSEGYYKIVKPWIEKELPIRVVGYLPEREELHFDSRHLGLFLPEEVAHVKEKLQAAAEIFSKTVSMECIKEIAEGAKELACESEESSFTKRVAPRDGRPIIAVARDEAFCFYYADNIRLLEEAGAGIKYFSPLRDEQLPEECHALLLGGGYPELYARQLDANVKMRAAVRRAAEHKMPIVAECGGFMYLHSFLKDPKGVCYNMVGVIPATCFYTGKLVRFGYVELRERNAHFLPDKAAIKGHEFHYYDSTYNGADVLAVKPATGKAYLCIVQNQTQWLGFPHLYYPSNPAFADALVRKAAEYKKEYNRRGGA